MILSILVSIISCDLVDDVVTDSGSGSDDDFGAVYTMTNNPIGNQVIHFRRNENGSLTKEGAYDTGGKGRDVGGAGFDPLESQDALIVDKGKRLLFAVNTGSNSVSSFIVNRDGSLVLTDVVTSLGEAPVALAFNGTALYIGNRQGGGSITGYYVNSVGKMTLIRNAILPGKGELIGSIDFTEDGRNLIYVEKGFKTFDNTVFLEGPNRIVSLPLDELYRPKIGEEKFIDFPDNDAPFAGEIFGDIYLLTSAGGISLTMPSGGGNTISYQVKDDGELEFRTYTPKIPNSATCWLEFSKDGKIAYVANTVLGTISSFNVEENGEISFLEKEAAKFRISGTVTPTNFPAFETPANLEIVISGDYLYTNTSLGARIDVLKINPDGSLTPKPELEVTDELFLRGTFYGLESIDL